MVWSRAPILDKPWLPRDGLVYTEAMTTSSQRTVAHVLVAGLCAQRVTLAFAVAGESYLAVLDALFDVRSQLRLITCRHEANAANMAEAVGKLTGRPGVCFVTRGPGASHASIAIHTAQQDATPLLVFIGQVATTDRGRDAFQEIDYQAMFGTVAKAVFTLDDPQRTSALLVTAFETAMNGRPGPVVISLPEDILDASCDVPVAPWVERTETPLQPEATRVVLDRLSQAKQPLLWIGGSGWSAEGVKALGQFADAWGLPVVSAFRRKDLMDNAHKAYVGEMGFALGQGAKRALAEADVVLALGTALGDVETGGYTRLDPATSASRVLHIAMRPVDLNRVFPTAFGAVASPSRAALALAASAAPTVRPWRDWARQCRALYEQDVLPVRVTGQVNLSEVFLELRRQLPADSIVTNGAGNYAAWLHRFFEHGQFGTQLAPQSGAMGYGVPAGIAAALWQPTRRVVAVSGDGCFMMAAQDLVTAAVHRARVVFLVVNNQSFGTIRMHQDNRFPGRTIATDLVNPDFVALSEASGVPATRVLATAEFAAALNGALAADGPRLIELVTSVNDIAPGRQLQS